MGGTSRLDESPLTPWQNTMVSPFSSNPEHRIRHEQYVAETIRKVRRQRARPELKIFTKEQRSMLNLPTPEPCEPRQLEFGTGPYVMSPKEKERFLSKIIHRGPTGGEGIKLRTKRIQIRSAYIHAKDYLTGLFGRCTKTVSTASDNAAV